MSTQQASRFSASGLRKKCDDLQKKYLTNLLNQKRARDMDEGGVRNLDQIQESDHESKTPRAVTLTLLVVGGACAIFAGYILPGRKSTPTKAVDPLGDLVAQRSHAAAAAPLPTDLSPHDVTFPGMLSDADKTTTALAAVRPNSMASAATLATTASPPPPTDRLPVVAIPAQNVLEASPIVTR